MKDKSVAVFGIQETNKNFQRQSLVNSFHIIVRGVSSHHKGAITSAQIGLHSHYQPGSTAVSVRDKWVTRYLVKWSDKMGQFMWIHLILQGMRRSSRVTSNFGDSALSAIMDVC
jgi:hypothetical protein